MNNEAPIVQLKGDLNLSLDGHLIKIECEGQSIKLTFSSFHAFIKFIFFYRIFNQKLFPLFLHHWMKHLRLTYYLTNIFIGESNPDLKPSWLGRYVGLERSKIYFSHLLTYFFKPSN